MYPFLGLVTIEIEIQVPEWFPLVPATAQRICPCPGFQFSCRLPVSFPVNSSWIQSVPCGPQVAGKGPAVLCLLCLLVMRWTLRRRSNAIFFSLICIRELNWVNLARYRTRRTSTMTALGLVHKKVHHCHILFPHLIEDENYSTSTITFSDGDLIQLCHHSHVRTICRFV